MASSADGYCTIVRFDDGELGVPLASSELPVGARKTATTNDDVSPPTMHTTIIDMPSSNKTTPHREISQIVSSGPTKKSGPRRVQLITLSNIPQSQTVATATTTSHHNTSHTSTVTNTLASTTDDVIL